MATMLPLQRGSMRGLRVLVVEDNDDAREMMKILLAAHGHEVATAWDAASALEGFERHASEVVFLDIGLPGTDGYDLVRRLREAPGGSGSLFVAITGYGGPDAVRRAQAAGFDLHLVKPVDPSRLVELLAARASGGAAA